MKNKNRVLLIVLTLSLGGNALLLYVLNYKKEASDQAFESSVMRIQSNLIRLEGSIEYQVDNGWANDTHVIEKLGDVVESIGLAFEIADRTGNLSNEVERTLWDLHHHFTRDYKNDTGYPNVHLSETEKTALLDLAEDLRRAGWRMNAGYSSDWSSFKSKANELLA